MEGARLMADTIRQVVDTMGDMSMRLANLEQTTKLLSPPKPDTAAAPDFTIINPANVNQSDQNSANMFVNSPMMNPPVMNPVITSTPAVNTQAMNNNPSLNTPASNIKATKPPNLNGSVTNSSSLIIKPRDIKILELDALHSLDSRAKLQIFFESIERCSLDSQDRLEVAKSRVDSELAVVIHTAQTRGEVNDWYELKNYLVKEFGVTLDFEQAWKQKIEFRYDWWDDPYAFVHKYKCHYQAIRGTFKNLPDRDQTLKRKLLHGFPQESREVLKEF